MTSLYITPNEYHGSDAQRINKAAADASELGLVLVIPKINEKAPVGQPRDLWLLDEAIKLPGNSTVELHNAHIKLSDRSRDNFIRSANCGLGIDPILPASNIHITGKGTSVLEGADHPRATADSEVPLSETSYGTDRGKEGESQAGDWRNIGILLAHVTNFSIENITIKESHCWAISLENSSQGRLRDLHFDSTGHRIIDGQKVKIHNQDGIDLRQGCHDILIENITGQTGDDLIALTAMRHQNKIAGQLHCTMITGEGDPHDGIHSVIIRNVRGHCAGGHHIVRFLNTAELPMYDIILDGVIDTSQPPYQSRAAVKIGDINPRWGGPNKLGLTSRMFISNITTRARLPIILAGSLCDSTISNVIQHDSPGDPIYFQAGDEHRRNVQITNVRNVTPVSDTPEAAANSPK